MRTVQSLPRSLLHLVLTLTALLTLATTQTCGPGVSKCDLASSPNKPMICDFQKDFVMSQDSGQCHQVSVEGCQLAAINIDTKPCFLCHPGKIIDLNSQQCVDPAQSLAKANCLRYLKDGDGCVSCDDHFWLNEGVCNAVTQKIENCAVYEDLTACQACKDSFRLKEGQCKRFQTLANCRSHTNLVCDRCSAETSFSLQVPGVSSVDSNILGIIVQRELLKGVWSEKRNLASSCRAGAVVGCQKYATPERCVECAQGYYIGGLGDILVKDNHLDNTQNSENTVVDYDTNNADFTSSELGKCQLNPESPLPNCLKYQDLQNCIECSGAYYVNGSPARCIAAAIVPNCLRYQQYKGVCHECDPKYWLEDLSKTCVLRNYQNIVDCEEIARLGDFCDKCRSPLVATLDMRRCLPFIENCVNLQRAAFFSDSAHICIRCLETHYLSENSCESRTRRNCQEYAFNSNQCVKCINSGYYIESHTSDCLKRTGTNCKEFRSQTNDCQICSPGYHLTNGQCFKSSINFCEVYADNLNHCTLCAYGLVYNAVICAPNPAQYCELLHRTNSNCETCIPNYYRVSGSFGGTCMRQSLANCILFQAQTNVCVTCTRSHTLSIANNTCVISDKPNCVEYTSNTDICTKCVAGYYVSAGGCLRQSKTACVEYASETNNCTRCAAGYFANTGSLQCERQNVANCVDYITNTGNCSICASGYYKKSPSECALQDIANCIEFVSDTNNCAKCAANYAKISGSECKILSTLNCIEFDMSSGNCTICAAGFWLNTSDSSCNNQFVANCLAYTTNTGNCTTCATGYWKKSDSECLKLSIPNCAVYNMADGKCSQCYDFHTLSADKATCTLNNTDKCIEYNIDGTCKICMAGAYLNASNSTCPLTSTPNCIEFTPNTNQCTRCKWGYYVNNFLCLAQNVANCVEYTDNSGNCSLCAIGYYLFSNSECKKISFIDNCIDYNLTSGACISCDARFYLSGSSCITRDNPECIEYTGTTGVCSHCQIGYYLDVANNNTCKLQNLTRCVDFASNVNTCATCVVESWLSGSVCVLKSVNDCIHYNSANGDCQTCRAGYYLSSSSSCLKQELTGCILHTANQNVCEKCGMKYYFQSGACQVRNLAGCTSYNADLNTCSACASGYYKKLDGSGCLQTNKAGCMTYTNENCITCVQGMWWDASGPGSCKPQSILNCAEFKDNVNECQTCAQGSYKASETSCPTVNKPNCIGYLAGTNVCAICAYGTFLETDKTCKSQNMVSKCVTYSMNSKTCDECQMGTYKNNDGSQCVTQAKSNCIKYKFNLNFCLVCAAGYYADSSGDCTAQNVDHCQTYTLGSGICSVCTSGFYLHSDLSNNITCKKQELGSCVTFLGNANICTNCDPLTYFEDNECKARDKTNCFVYNADVNTCANCVQLFKPAATGGGCEANSHISNCKLHSTSEPSKCSECVPGYYSNSGVCAVQNNIAHCVLYEANQPKCKTCSAQYLVNSGQTVCNVNTNVSNCAAYSLSDKTQCTQCVTLYYLANSTTCTLIDSSTNCYSSDGTSTNTCERCKPDFYRSASGAGFCITGKSTSNIDPFCLYVTESEDNRKCNQCQTGYFPVTGAMQSKTVAQMTAINCVKVNETTGVCVQCLEWYQLGAGGSCTLETADKRTLLCRQKVEGDTSALTDATNCAVCSYSSVYYNNSGTCTSRGSKVNLQNCAKFSSNSDECLGCKLNTYKTQISFSEICTANSGINGNGTLITSCAIYKKATSPAECKICDQGFELSGATSCVSIVSSRKILRAYDSYMDPKESYSTPSVINNCVYYLQMDAVTAVCGKCASGYVGIVSYDISNTTTGMNMAYSSDNEMGVKTIINSFSECINSDKILFIGTAPATLEDTCAVGYKSSTGYACLRCISGRLGSVSMADNINNGSYASPTLAALGSALFTVSTCLAITTMKRLKQMMHGMYIDKAWALRWHNHFNFDTCVLTGTSNADTSKSLVYMYLIDLAEGHLSRSVHRDATNGGSVIDLKQAYCVDNAKITNAVDNCQFYALETDFSGDITPGTATYGNAICASCQAGYKPNTFIGKIASCTLITNCDISNASKNTWLNTCQTPTHGAWAFNTASTPAIIEYHSPVTESQKADNCVAVDITRTNWCVICLGGYHAMGGECAPALGLGGSCLYRLGRVDFVPESGVDSLKRMQFSNLVLLRWEIISVNYINMVSPYCGRCASTPSPSSSMLQEGLTSNVCVEQSPPPGGSASNCEWVDFSNLAKCQACKTGHAIKSDETCAAATPTGTLEDCLQSNNAENTCLKCTDNKYWSSGSSKCLLHYCLEWDTSNSSHCLICNQGKALSGSDLTHCSSGANSETNCDYTSPKLGHCVKGKNGKVPYVIFSVYASENGGSETLKRTVFKTMALAGATYTQYNLDYKYLKIVHVASESSATAAAELKYVATASQETRVFTNSLTSSDLSTNHCFANNTDTNCSSTFNSVCKKCNSGYFPGLDGLCAPTSQNTSCEESYSDGRGSDTLCSSCPSNMYYTAPNTCTNRSVSATCPGKSPTSDTCTSCGGIQYPNGSGACVDNTATNCDSRSNEKNECKKCEMGFYANSSDPSVCTAYSTAANCHEYNPSADECLSCEHSYRESSKTCVIVTKPRCKTYVNVFDTTDECATCQPDWMVSSGSCVSKTALRCKTFHISDDKCTSCADGYTLGVKNCEAKTPRLCATFKTGFDAGSNMCLTCSDDFLKKDSGGFDICEMKTALLCKEFKTGADDKCKGCTGSYVYDSGAGTCSLKSSGTCLSPYNGSASGDASKCGSCTVGYQLTGDQCVIKAATLCMEYQTTADKCKTCSILHNLGSRDCELKTASGCKTVKPETDACLTCPDSLYYKNGNSCTANTGLMCNGLKTEADGCQSCFDGFVASGGNCVANTANLCLLYKSDTHGCKTCSAKTVYDGTTHCILKTASNCLSFSATLDGCETCSDGFLFSNSFPRNCVANTGQNCLTYMTNSHGCATCTKLRKLDFYNNCVLKSALNCLTISNSGALDSCLTCSVGFVFNNNTGNCDRSSAHNCLTFSTTSHICLTCPSYYLKNSANLCDRNEGSYCKGIGAAERGCDVCALGFYLENGTRNCITGDRADCMSYKGVFGAASGGLNECDTCSVGFKKDSNQNCVKKTIQNCIAYANDDLDQCVGCKHGFWSNGDGCTLITAQKCLLMSSVADTCSTCSDLSYKSSSDCVEQANSNCQGFNTNAVGCAACSTGFVANGSTNNCDLITGTNCLTFLTSQNGCAACSTSRFYKSGDTCLAKSGSNCDAYKAAAPGCDTCNSNFHKHANNLDCVKTAKTNCFGFKTNQNECNACKPNFVLNNSSKNCDLNNSTLCLNFSTSALTCQNCSYGYLISSPNCVANNSANCKTFNTTSQECLECADLFYKDSFDNICKRNNAAYCLEFDANNNECKACETGFYIQSKTCVMVDKTHCLTFKPDQNNCNSCIRGFVLNTTSSQCEANHAGDCQVHAMNEHKCLTCHNGYYKAPTGLCVKINALNCQTFSPDSDSCFLCEIGYWKETGPSTCNLNTAVECLVKSRVAGQCLECNSGMYLNASSGYACTELTAENCLIGHKSLDQCVECKEGSIGRLEGGTRLLCESRTALNCLSYDTGKDRCLTCINTAYRVETQLSSNSINIICEIRSEKNCNVPNLTTDTCASCLEGYFKTSDGTCTRYTVIKFCKLYFTNTDQCEVCSDGYYKVPNTNECRIFPNGLTHCISYQSRYQCKICDSESYLDVSTCRPVIQSVPKCAEYLTASDCRFCQSGHLLFENSCVAITAENCEEFATAATCRTCKNNFVLSFDGRCLQSNIPNCQSAANIGGNILCTKCQSGHVLDDKMLTCTTPNLIIQNCLTYKNENECQSCADDFLLSQDMKNCLILEDRGGTGCVSGHLTESVMCDECDFGYQRDTSGKCVVLTLANCYLLAVGGQNCMMCATGFYMDTNGGCIGYEVSVEPVKLPGDDTRVSAGEVVVAGWLAVGAVWWLLT